MNRPPNRPECSHGLQYSAMHPCKKCYEERLVIEKAVQPLVDEFWDNKGTRDLSFLMTRAYRKGMKSEIQ